MGAVEVTWPPRYYLAPGPVRRAGLSHRL